MIIILTLLTIAMIITYFSWKDGKKCHGNNENGIAAAIIVSIILTMISALAWSGSYSTYLETRSFYSATKEQYHSAIEIYGDYAVIDMGKAAFTDLKYQGYQENISGFITDLRNEIIKYNKTIVEKRIMGKNLFFSWFIIEPDDDMVIIKMKLE